MFLNVFVIYTAFKYTIEMLLSDIKSLFNLSLVISVLIMLNIFGCWPFTAKMIQYAQTCIVH